MLQRLWGPWGQVAKQLFVVGQMLSFLLCKMGLMTVGINQHRAGSKHSLIISEDLCISSSAFLATLKEIGSMRQVMLLLTTIYVKYNTCLV